MRAFFRSMPWSFGWFALTGVIFLLQWFPFTGIFLMLVVAPFWSIATLNLGFLSFVLEVLTRRIGVAWLALPLAWFGGYAGVAYISHQRAALLNEEIRAANSGGRVAFEPGRQALVFDTRAYQLSSAPRAIAQRYRVPVVYETNSQTRDVRPRALRVAADPLCKTVRADKAFRAADVQAWPIREGDRSFMGDVVEGLCLLISPEEPGEPRVRVAATEEKKNEFLLPYTLTRLVIRDADGKIARLTVGTAEPLYWFPLPVMGCALNSGAARWECLATFWRAKVPLGGNTLQGSVPEVIADALGLVKVSASDRRNEVAALAVPSMDEIVRSRVDRSLAVLDEVIADPKRRITIFDVKGLTDRSEVLGDRPPGMVEAIGRVLAVGHSGYETARVLQGLLVALPAPQFDAIGPALLAVLGEQPALGRDTVEQTMASRIGRLGVAAMPVLERMTFAQPKRPYAPALYGLCRVGRDAAALAERIAVLAPQDGNSREYDTAVYVALMRIGRSDIVEWEKALGRFSKVEKRVVDRAITAESPPSVCTDGSNWPRVPE